MNQEYQSNIAKTLVVEDMKLPLEAIAVALRLYVLNEPKPIRLSGNPEEELRQRCIDVARNYAAAERAISQNSYKVVLLDHNLPMCEGGDAENIGYTLVNKIREMNPDAVIVGTSSMISEETGLDELLDHKVDKSGQNLGNELKSIYDRLI